MFRSSLVALILGLAFSFVPTSVAQDSHAGETPSDLILILDASGSMWGQIDGENKIVIARRVLGELIDDLPDGLDVGLVAYGHRREGDCTDIESVVALGPVDKAALKETVNGLNPKGKTPITASIEHAFEIVRDAGGASTVVLVSDGLETCGGDPCAMARQGQEQAQAQGLDVRMHVVAFDIAEDELAQLECVAQAGGGRFLSADDAAELGTALETVVAAPVAVPDGRLSISAEANGALQDVSIHVTDVATGEDMGGGRTYTDPSTNPRILPLDPGTYDVSVRAIGIKGDVERRFENLVIADEVVEKHLDFSTGEIVIGVTRNAARSDATVRIYVAGETKTVASQRTYTGEKSNPKRVTLTAGTYDVSIKSVEIESNPEHAWKRVEVPPKGSVELDHEFDSATLSIGVVRGDTLIDATLAIIDGSGKSIAAARTYTSDRSNPKTFIVPPGAYRVRYKELKGEAREFTVTVGKGETLSHTVDLDAEG